MFCVFFFKQKTAYEMRISDWSSDVCSSDLNRLHRAEGGVALILGPEQHIQILWQLIGGLRGRGRAAPRRRGAQQHRRQKTSHDVPPPGGRKSTRLNSSH